MPGFIGMEVKDESERGERKESDPYLSPSMLAF